MELPIKFPELAHRARAGAMVPECACRQCKVVVRKSACGLKVLLRLRAWDFGKVSNALFICRTRPGFAGTPPMPMFQAIGFASGFASGFAWLGIRYFTGFRIQT
jgi:hypothetical protein